MKFSILLSIPLLSVLAAAVPTCNNEPFEFNEVMLPQVPSGEGVAKRQDGYCGQCYKGKTCCQTCSSGRVVTCTPICGIPWYVNIIEMLKKR